MATHDTIRTPREGDYATLSADGRSVLCHRRLDESRHCAQRLVARHTATRGREAPDGRWHTEVLYTVLVFEHDGWELQGGVWRLPPVLATRLRRGLSVPVRLRPSYDWEPAYKWFVLDSFGQRTAVPDLPALVRCPRCENKRWLDGPRLDAVGARQCGWSCDRPGRGARGR